MSKYIVNYTRKAVDGFDELKHEIEIEALDPGAAALIAGALILADTLKTSAIGNLLSTFGVDAGELGDITADAFKDCVNVQVLAV